MRVRKVAIIQRILPHYRHALFEALNVQLLKESVELKVFFGREVAGTVPRTLPCIADWATEIRNQYVKLGQHEAVLQHIGGQLANVDLIVVEHAAKFPLNYWLQFERLMGRRKLAFWGHGRNFQAEKRNSPVEFLKRKLLTSVDWWFAYTALSAREISSCGFPAARITTLNNTIDTTEFERALRGIDASTVCDLRVRLGISGDCVGLYCGGMYPDKRLPFLIRAAELIKGQVPSFELILIGDGPDSYYAAEAAKRHAWIRYIGAVFGLERVPYFALSKVFLMPGSVGLAIVDAFAAGVPLASTNIPYHGPEIEYLVNEVNGIMTVDDESEFALGVSRFLLDMRYQTRLREGCERAARELTLARMVENFSDGILRCLSHDAG